MGIHQSNLPALRRTRARLLACCLLFSPSTLFAWGDQGHEITGIIAYAHLTPTAKKGIDALLAADKDDLTATDFVSRTTWADKYRNSDRNTTRLRYLATREWHFVDIEITDGKIDAPCHFYPKLPTGVPASAGPPKACLLEKINQFVAELNNPATDINERMIALKYLLHLIGDLHQPLHTASNHDRGGNNVPILIGDPAGVVNLHAYWDIHLVQTLADDHRAFAAHLIKQISQTHVEQWSKGQVVDWAKDSFYKAQRVVYDFNGAQERSTVDGAKALFLAKSYQERARALAREQLSKAGIRLAAMLNRIFN